MPSLAASSFFGWSVDVDEGRCLVGARHASVSATGSGGAFDYRARALTLSHLPAVAQAGGAPPTLTACGGLSGSPGVIALVQSA